VPEPVKERAAMTIPSHARRLLSLVLAAHAGILAPAAAPAPTFSRPATAEANLPTPSQGTCVRVTAGVSSPVFDPDRTNNVATPDTTVLARPQ